MFELNLDNDVSWCFYDYFTDNIYVEAANFSLYIVHLLKGSNVQLCSYVQWESDQDCQAVFSSFGCKDETTYSVSVLTSFWSF